MIARSVYPLTSSLADWLNHTLMPVEESVFRYFQSLADLVDLVDAAEREGTPGRRYAAMSAIRDYNEDNRTTVTYEDLANRTSTYIFTDFGEWAVYTEHPAALLEGDLDDELEAILARAEGSYQILWLTNQNLVVMYRSPYIDDREVYDTEDSLAYGFGRGGDAAFVLPPDIEAAVAWDLNQEPEEDDTPYRRPY